MKRTPINIDPALFPAEFRELLQGANIYDSSCSPEAKVYYISKDKGYFLKVNAKGALEREALMDQYFDYKGIGASVLSYCSFDRDYLLTERVIGEDLTHPDYLSDGKWLAENMGLILRRLHETRANDCPIKDRVSEYIALAESNYMNGTYDKTALIEDSFGYKSAAEAYAVLEENKKILKSDTLIHGDFCLPNIIMNGKSFSGYIDLGNAGIGDRHIDLFWGAWTLYFNLKTDKYTDRFFDSYGRDLVDPIAIRTVAAAEVFG